MGNGKAHSFFHTLGERLMGGTARFSAAFCATALLFGCCTYNVFSDDEGAFFGSFGLAAANRGVNFSTMLAYGAAWGIAAAVTAQLACERRGKTGRRLPWAAMLCAAALAASLWYRPLMVEGAEATRPARLWNMAYFGVLAAAVCTAVWLLYTVENQEMLFGHLVKSVFFCGAVALVLYLGLLLCLAATDALLVSLSWRAYALVSLLVWVLLFPNLVFSYLPRPGEGLNVPRAYLAIVGYAALPVYLILLGVLYGYLVKILLTRDLPAGTMNWYPSFALAAWVFFWLGLRMHPNALIQKFLRWGWVLQLPVLAAQLVCIGIRLSAYGLTAARWLSLVCIGLGAATLLLAALCKTPRGWFLAAGIVALAVALTPLNPMDVGVFSQTQRLKSALTAQGMWDGAAITPRSDVPVETQEAIESAWNYLAYNEPVYYRSALLSQAVPDTQALYDRFFETFGFAYGEATGGGSYDDIRYYSLSAAQNGVSVEGFSRIYAVNTYGDVKDSGEVVAQSWEDGTELSAPVGAYLAKLAEKYTPADGALSEEDALLMLDDGRELYCTSLSFTEEDGVLHISSFSGYLLVP